MGYNFFNINSLTIAETNVLVEAFNEREKEKARDFERNKTRKK
jgi:hypothetical protein